MGEQAGKLGQEHFAEHVLRSAARHPQIAVSRPRPGANGVVRSYREARETFDLADRLGVDRPVIPHPTCWCFRCWGGTGRRSPIWWPRCSEAWSRPEASQARSCRR
ncbi:hypothetical protein [Streptomyces deserti]